MSFLAFENFPNNKKCLGYVDLLTQIIETINFSADVQEFIEVNNSGNKL